jgi:PLD-like domain
MKPIVKVFTTANESKIVFKYDSMIPNCNGFAIFKREKRENIIKEPHALNNFLSYKNQMTAHKHTAFPSTSSPIQRFTWNDYSADEGDIVSYRVVPMLMINGVLHQDTENASDWTDFATLGFNGKRKAYFNRGIVSSQFLANRLKAIDPNFKKETLMSQLFNRESAVREFLGGDVGKYLHKLLDEVKIDPELSIFTVLYELNEDELEDKLMAIGGRVNLILCNGQAKTEDDPSTPFDDRKPNEKAALRLANSQVQMFRRRLEGGAAHHKFMVICRKGVAESVWTGSTNWTTGGLYTQVNNAILIQDAQLADIYLKQWGVVKEVVDKGEEKTSPIYYKVENKEAHSIGDSTVWFSPTKSIPNTGNFKFNDLEAVKLLLENAKSGILYLMFSPSMNDTHSLYDAILDIHSRKSEQLFIHGVLNSERGIDKDNPEISFQKRGDIVPKSKIITDFPANIKEDFANWIRELAGLNVKIHSKIIVIDPFGTNPVVITGSHNLGIAASGKNDENMLIIKNDKVLAHAYAVNILTIFDHFYWRYVASHDATSIINTGLDISPDWMANFIEDEDKMQEINFWLNDKKVVV